MTEYYTASEYSDRVNTGDNLATYIFQRIIDVIDRMPERQRKKLINMILARYQYHVRVWENKPDEIIVED